MSPSEKAAARLLTLLATHEEAEDAAWLWRTRAKLDRRLVDPFTREAVKLLYQLETQLGVQVPEPEPELEPTKKRPEREGAG